MVRIACIGECMVELSAAGADNYTLAFGGDTLNTATYLARQGLSVDYITALGDDHLSARMLALWQAEGIGTAHVLRLAGRMPGLYMIERDDAGERSFSYWRDRAPARELMTLADEALIAALTGFDWLYLSGITLSLYGDEGRTKLLDVLRKARRRGARIAFDGNYRPRGWHSPAHAASTFDAILPLVDTAFPTLDDEQMLYPDADAQACASRMLDLGVREVVVKQGAQGCLVATRDGMQQIAAMAVRSPADTTAAGDSFNAAYLGARLRGASPRTAAKAGHTLASIVIQHRGAIIPPEAMPVLDGTPEHA